MKDITEPTHRLGYSFTVEGLPATVVNIRGFDKERRFEVAIGTSNDGRTRFTYMSSSTIDSYPEFEASNFDKMEAILKAHAPNTVLEYQKVGVLEYWQFRNLCNNSTLLLPNPPSGDGWIETMTEKVKSRNSPVFD